MRPSTVLGILLTLLLHGVGSTLSAAGGEKSTPGKSVKPKDKIRIFDLNRNQAVGRSASDDIPRPTGSRSAHTLRRSVGSALSPNAGIGKGASIDLTFDDAQQTQGQGRHISHWWNGEYGGSAEVSVHFGYGSMTDTLLGYPEQMSGYNVYNAIGGVWPRGQDIGCDLQIADTLGWGTVSSLDVMSNGRAVMTSMSHYFNGFLAADSAYVDNMVFYQGSEFSCTHWPGLNTTFIDSTVYRPLFMDQSEGNYSRHPQVITQWDGVNNIVHVLLFETLYTPLGGDDYAADLDYITCLYFRKIGETADAGAWSAGQIIDSLWFPWASMAAAPFPHANVAVSYTNPSYYGALLNQGADLDVWYRESLDRGLTWQQAVDFTNYMNAIAGDPNHFVAWLESQCLYSTDGDLHVVWTAKETSYDPYFDGFNWTDVDQNVYHWSRSTAEVSKVAHGTYTDGWDCLLGSINTLHCGFGGSNAGYIANVNLAECDDKLYCVWNQIHERATRMPWRHSPTQPAPGVLDDCSYTGSRLAMANWEILMSVARLETSWFWDRARNVSDTYTPNCGLVGDPDAAGPCASDYKPAVEKYGLDESGLDLTWPPETLVDMNPDVWGPYTGNWFLNMQYLDDQFPGPAFWERTNPPASLNSLKWIRLACVEPIEAPEIQVYPELFWWPQWVELGGATDLTVTVMNDGNVMLNITEIGGVENTGSGWLELPMWPPDMWVMPGLGLSITFDIVFNATGLSSTQWLDGEVWLKSDAINEDSTSILIHLLAASDVEPVRWDTVQSHANMFDPYFLPKGECVALAVSNMGEFGWGAGTSGSINLDYRESGFECGQRFADGIYLRSGSAFVITADDSQGANAQLTCSYYDLSQAQETGWDPTGDRGSIDGGLAAGGEYDSVYTGRFVNRDTSIAMERIFYTPRSYDPENETINYVICYTKFFSDDGQAHDHVTVGNVIDWNVPSEEQSINTSGVSPRGYLYVQGTDTLGVLSCQSHTGRFATEVFGGGYTSADLMMDHCANDEEHFGFNALSQSLLEDTTHYRDGTPLIPSQPNPEVWWQETSIPGLNPDANPSDQAVWFTYKHDFNLGAQDTLHFWTVLTTTLGEWPPSLADLEDQVDHAKGWYTETMRGCDYGCCRGRVGDANGIGGDEPTIGDVSTMIDATFISIGCGISGEWMFGCPQEADVNQSGGTDPYCDDITIGDISVLIDYLFITGRDLGLNDCLSGWKSGEKTSMPCK